MSYDLMVFVPEAAPRERGPFMEWYVAQADATGDDPAIADPRLRAWLTEMVKRFPAVNGPLAGPDPEHPQAADYGIGDRIVYASFAWPDADAARACSIELARKHELGFCDVSAPDPSPLFPEQARLDALYEGEKDGRSVSWSVSAWDEIADIVRRLDPRRAGFAVFSIDRGQYVQCAGSRDRLTVECRTLSGAVVLRHYVFGKGVPGGVKDHVPSSVGQIEIDRSQVLAAGDALEIVRFFLESRGGLHPAYTATDITARFGQ